MTNYWESSSNVHSSAGSLGASKTDGTSEIPPAGCFPARIRYYPAPPGGMITLQFDVQWGPNAIYKLTRQIKPTSIRGGKLLEHLQFCAGIMNDSNYEQLDGRHIAVAGSQALHRGKLRWEAKNFRRHTDLQTQDENDAGVIPDGNDYLARKVITGEKDARFIRDGDHIFILPLGKEPIPIDPNSNEYAAFQHRHIGVGTVEPKGRVVAQRVLIQAMRCADALQFMRFSFADSSQIYVPVEGGKILRIAGTGFGLVINCEGIWLVHPKGNPVRWMPDADPHEGLRKLEDLLIQTSAIQAEPMRFVLAANLAFLPYMRHLVPIRPIIEMHGGTGQGKTSAARRYLRQHQLGDVQGDYSLAQVKRDGDVGLIVRDNLETLNLTRFVEDFVIFASTGGEWGRVGVGRDSSHPVIAATTVEGISRRSEVSRRLLRFEFKRDRDPFPETAILSEIDKHRALIFRGIAEVLRCLLAQNPELFPKIIPMGDFPDYCSLIYQVLVAYEQVSGKPVGFADGIFEFWYQQEHSRHADDSAGPYARLLERLCRRVLRSSLDDEVTAAIATKLDYSFGGHKGCLFIATPTAWLTALKEIARWDQDVRLPAEPEGLRNRLKELKPERGYILVTDKDDKDTLARKGSKRIWGILEIHSTEEA
jgi:hypothetical protein